MKRHTLRERLQLLLAEGLSEDPLEHAQQVARIAGILEEAFSAAGFQVTMVGGSAIEIHSPGIHKSGDIDVVIERTRADLGQDADEVFRDLGFQREGMHWRYDDILFVHVVSGPVAGPAERVQVGGVQFRVVAKEVPLRDRIVGFMHWKYTGYAQQAIDMLVAFGEELDMGWLADELRKEDALDAFEELRELAASDAPVTERVLRDTLKRLHARAGAERRRSNAADGGSA